jgi:hypothetical protein
MACKFFFASSFVSLLLLHHPRLFLLAYMWQMEGASSARFGDLLLHHRCIVKQTRSGTYCGWKAGAGFVSLPTTHHEESVGGGGKERLHPDDPFVRGASGMGQVREADREQDGVCVGTDSRRLGPFWL